MQATCRSVVRSQRLRGVADQLQMLRKRAPIRNFLSQKGREELDRASEWNQVAEKSHKIEDGTFQLLNPRTLLIQFTRDGKSQKGRSSEVEDRHAVTARKFSFSFFPHILHTSMCMYIPLWVMTDPVSKFMCSEDYTRKKKNILYTDRYIHVSIVQYIGMYIHVHTAD